ncbi:hypothetical protein GJ496_005916, partial [Pomphorhynchus laevis]
VGKTHLIEKIANELLRSGKHVHGFITREVRDPATNSRTGFVAITLPDESTVPLASIHNESAKKTIYRVGRYTVDIDEFEIMCKSLLEYKDIENVYIVIDEIGKMELFSNDFKQVIMTLCECSNLTIIATVPAIYKNVRFANDLRCNAKIPVLE